MSNTVGKRIKRARKGAGWSLRRLADQTDKSHTTIAKYESGEIVPDSAMLTALAEALDVRTEFFLRPGEIELGEVEFRTHIELTRQERDRIEALVLEKAERYFELLRLYPQIPVGGFELPDGLPDTVDDYRQLEAVADQLRENWNLGFNSIANLIDELESRGILVLSVELGEERAFDGLSAQIEEHPLIVLGSDWPGDRQRFTAAHELGHLVLNSRVTDDLDLEVACNRFAGAFLVPQTTVFAALGRSRQWLEPRELYSLKHEYGLSMSAWLHRAEELGIINQSTYEKLRRHFRERDWQFTEPGEQLPREEPALFEQLVYHGLAEELFGESKAAELMGMPVAEFHVQRTMGEDVDGARR